MALSQFILFEIKYFYNKIFISYINNNQKKIKISDILNQKCVLVKCYMIY